MDTPVLLSIAIEPRSEADREKLDRGLAVTRLAQEPVESIRDGLLAEVRAWMPKQFDDLTFLIARHRTKRA